MNKTKTAQCAWFFPQIIYQESIPWEFNLQIFQHFTSKHIFPLSKVGKGYNMHNINIKPFSSEVVLQLHFLKREHIHHSLHKGKIGQRFSIIGKFELLTEPIMKDRWCLRAEPANVPNLQSLFARNPSSEGLCFFRTLSSGGKPNLISPLWT